ncbi:porin family protein [Massilia sp. CF038]|jgi:OOP family OmpA-OmpF porin|uniref:porin family protein n=1 Tax=Massilia sp. CF038 TaxID=1881045 RepID=UPI00091B5EA7|nr:porin family protein [Massilia sp. CF038]SHH42753.1 OmpA-OmpF porin, OOP family [Massilia sp. CF038]
MKKIIFAMIAGATVFSGAAMAQSKPYVGVAVASASNEFKIGGATNVDAEGWKPAAKIFGGVDFTPTFGMEAGYTDLRKADTSFNIGGTGYTGTTDGHRAYLAGKATMPVNEQFSVYGKLGAGYTKTKLSTTAPGLSGSDSKTEVYAGLGGQYNLSDKAALILEYERYGKSKDVGAKADAITAGAKFSF